MNVNINLTQNIKMGDSSGPRKEGLFRRWFKTHVNNKKVKYDEEALNEVRNSIQ